MLNDGCPPEFLPQEFSCARVLLVEVVIGSVEVVETTVVVVVLAGKVPCVVVVVGVGGVVVVVDVDELVRVVEGKSAGPLVGV